MVVKTQVDEITEVLMSLPPAKVAAVKDFVDYLKSRYGDHSGVDESDEWTEEDLRDFAAGGARYGETVAPWDDGDVANDRPQGGGE
jgi:hypothetical protein